MGLLGAIGAAGVVQGQVRITVKDATSEEVVPYAHVTWTKLATKTSGLAVAGPDGRCHLPMDEADAGPGMALRVDFLGYASFLDTLHDRSPHVVRLQRGGRYSLDELVVTGQYRPTRADKAVQRLRVIGADRIQNMAAQTLADVLSKELHMRLVQDNVLGTAITMRGLGGENVKILVDGVPMIGRQDGNIDLAQIDMAGIERVEVIEGPLSVQYGTNALAGTINLITRKNVPDGRTVNAGLYVEPVGRMNLSVMAGQHFGKSDLVLSLGRNYFAGWAPGQSAFYDFTRQPADSSRSKPWKPREQYNGRISLRHVLNDRWTLNYKGEAMSELVLDRGAPRKPYQEQAFDAEFNTLRIDNGIFATGELGRGRRLEGFAAYNHYRRQRDSWLRDLTTMETRPLPDLTDRAEATLTNVRVSYAHANDSAKVGFEVGLDVNLETAIGDRVADGSRQNIGDNALFASMQWRPGTSFTVRPGLRVAYNTKYDAPVVPSLDLRIQLDSSWTLRASYAQGFRAPSLKELYMNFVDVNHNIQGNPDLKAESSNSYTLALNYREPTDKGILRMEAVASHDRLENMISMAFTGSGSDVQYVNVGIHRTVAGNLTVGWEMGHWDFGMGAGMVGRYDTLGYRQYGQAYRYTPEGSANFSRHWRKHGWSANLYAKYQGERNQYVLNGDGTIGQGQMQAYALVDASVSKELGQRKFTITVGCKNLTDVTDLRTTVSGGGAHDAGATGAVSMSTGRTPFFRVAMNLQGTNKNRE